MEKRQFSEYEMIVVANLRNDHPEHIPTWEGYDRDGTIQQFQDNPELFQSAIQQYDSQYPQ